MLAGHIQILQTIIVTLTNSLTQPCSTDEDISRAEVTGKCLRLSLRLARNLCAGVQHNQTMLCDSPVPDAIIKLIDRVDGKPIATLDGFETIALQLLGNLCVDFRSGQDKIWSLLYPHLFCNLLCEESTSTLEVCYMIIHNCVVKNPDRMILLCTNKKLADLLWHKILLSDSDQEWG